MAGKPATCMRLNETTKETDRSTSRRDCARRTRLHRQQTISKHADTDTDTSTRVPRTRSAPATGHSCPRCNLRTRSCRSQQQTCPRHISHCDAIKKMSECVWIIHRHYQESWPGASWNCPDGQGVHAVAPLCVPIVPGGLQTMVLHERVSRDLPERAHGLRHGGEAADCTRDARPRLQTTHS